MKKKIWLTKKSNLLIESKKYFLFRLSEVTTKAESIDNIFYDLTANKRGDGKGGGAISTTLGKQQLLPLASPGQLLRSVVNVSVERKITDQYGVQLAFW